jgi:hypothetical protein
MVSWCPVRGERGRGDGRGRGEGGMAGGVQEGSSGEEKRDRKMTVCCVHQVHRPGGQPIRVQMTPGGLERVDVGFKRNGVRWGGWR